MDVDHPPVVRILVDLLVIIRCFNTHKIKMSEIGELSAFKELDVNPYKVGGGTMPGP